MEEKKINKVKRLKGTVISDSNEGMLIKATDGTQWTADKAAQGGWFFEKGDEVGFIPRLKGNAVVCVSKIKRWIENQPKKEVYHGTRIRPAIIKGIVTDGSALTGGIIIKAEDGTDWIGDSMALEGVEFEEGDRVKFIPNLYETRCRLALHVGKVDKRRGK